MIGGFSAKRIEGEYDYQTTKLRNLFAYIFQDQVAAWVAWDKAVSREGVDFAIKTLDTRPKKFGTLRGRVRFGFLKDRAFSEREKALRDAAHVSHVWYSAHLQFSQLQQLMTAPEAQASKPQNNSRSHERGQEEERGR